jgi:hypothetical protein
VSNLPSLPGGLPSGIPGVPGGLPSSLPSSLPNLPSASSLASGGLGSGGSLPSSIPGASLLPNPIPGNYRSQVAQGQALFQAAQNAAAGTPGSVATLLQGAATTVTNMMGAGLPKTLITDAAGIAAGFAMGGPVGGAVAMAATAASLFASLFSGNAVIWEGFEAKPSDASIRNWQLVQNYIANLVGASESGYPPGWYLAYYQAATAPPYTLSDLTDLFLLKVGSLQTKGGDPSAIAYLAEIGSGLVNLTIETGYNGREMVFAFLKDTPWKTPCRWQWTPATGYPQKKYPKPTDTQFRAQLMTTLGKHPFDEIWESPVNGGGFTTAPLAYLWGAPTGAGLPGSLSQGLSALTTPGSPSLAATPSEGPLGFTASMVDMGMSSIHEKPAALAPPNTASIWSQALSDISDKPGMSRASIATRAMKLAPRSVWFDPSLYQMTANVDNKTVFTALYNLDILNALATIWVMSACGAHPRAITTELLVQQANIYEHGGPNPGVQNLSAAYRRFMDEWLNISQGYPPDNHVPVLGQMSRDAPPEAKTSHVQNLSTLSQWVQHYLG